MEFDKECGVMVERLSWEDLQSHQLSLQNSEMSLVNLQRSAIKEEMDYEEECNYDHLSKDDLINEVKARDDRIRKLEAKCNVLISKMAKERVKTSLTINKQINEIERLNRVIKDLENRIKDLMEKSGILQFPNDELVKTEPVEDDMEINGQELTLPVVMHSVQGILCKENIIEESHVSEVRNTNTETTLKKTEYMGYITRITNPCVTKLKYSGSLPQSAPSPKIKVEPIRNESDPPREPLENNITINDSYRKSPSVSTEGDTEDNSTPSKRFRVPELNVESEKHLDLSLDANVEEYSLEGSPENDLADNQYRINLTGAKKSDILSVPMRVPEVERNPIELSELTPVSMESDLPEVPIAVQHNSSVSNSETLEDVAPKNPEGKTSSPRSEIAGKFEKKRITGTKFSTEYERGLRLRVRKGKEEKRFKSEQCNYGCSQKSSLNINQRIHSGEKPFKCDRCEYKCTQKSTLIRHERMHSREKRFKCDQCDYASTMKYNLIIHQRVHSGEKPFKCDQCGYAFTQTSSLYAHQRIHSGVKPHKCDQCKYASTKKNSLIIHQRMHSGEKPFKCDRCEYRCSRKSHLIAHQRIHSGEKPFKCDQCDHGFTQKSSLDIHKRIHSGEKPFKCDQCEYRCSRKSHLIAHQRIYSGEKPFKCDQCEYRCSRKSHLIEHQHIHSGEKPHKCDQCKYASTNKNTLIIHQRRHSGEKPFRCDQCDYACARKYHLTLHKRNRHMYE